MARESMDEHSYQRAMNNPAMTVPASSQLSPTTTRRSGLSRQPTARSLTSRISNTSAETTTDKLSGPDPDNNVALHDEGPNNAASKSKYDRGWRRIVRNFSPSWFSVTMGTGVVSLILYSIPFQTDWLYWLSVVFFILNLCIFMAATVISLLRYTLYPEIWTVMIQDPTNSLFLGTSCMGMATLVQALINLCCPYWGVWATYLAWGLWMVNAVLSLAVTLSLSFLLISQSKVESLDRITAAQLLPIATTIVASGLGAKSAQALMNQNADPHWVLATVLVSFVLWAMSTPFALVILVIYYQRLAVHKLPPREIIVSSFLPLGPLGMGGNVIILLGRVAHDLLPQVTFLAHIPAAPQILYILGLLGALLMWSYGLTWLVYALAAISSCGSFPFNMGWWGFTFPLGVFALSTIQLGIEFPSLFFRVLGTLFGLCVVLLWIVVFLGTVRGAWRGHLFYAPCLKNLPRSAKHGACVSAAPEEIRAMANEHDLEKGAR